MDSYLLKSLFLFLVFQFFQGSYSQDDDFGLEFCEAQKYISAGRNACPTGITFGNQTPPTCICVRGIYRAYMESCDVADGFAKDVCMLPYEKLPGHTERYPKINRLLAMEFVAEPDWDKTTVVVESLGRYTVVTDGDEKVPDTMTVASSEAFYMVNGKAFLGKGRDLSKPATICVEPSDDMLGGTQVCKVLKSGNRVLWHGSETIFAVRKTKGCWHEFGEMKPMKHEPCIRPLMPRNDECSAKCVREGRVKDPLYPNCPDAVKTMLWDNEFMERQLKQFIVQSQVKGKPTMDAGEPIRTMELFQTLVNITSGFCPETFVKPEWLTWMSDLFYLLHKGNRYRYAETITEADAKAIKQILEDCNGRGYKVRLTNFVEGMVKDRRCHRNDLGPAVGYCKNEDENCLKPILIDPINEKLEHKIRSKHYVPEVAWNILDATQAICFREFNASYRMFHILQQAVESLFTHEIKSLWYNPPSNHKERLKTMISGKGAEERIGNLEICTGSAYHILNSEAVAKFGPHVTMLQRLTRPSMRKYLRRRRSVNDKPQENGYDSANPNDALGKMTEVFCRPAYTKRCDKEDYN